MHTQSMQTNTQNIQSHKPIHAHNYKSLYVHTNACVRTHGHPSKYAHTCSYTKPLIHVITPTKHTGAHSYTQKCTNVCHLRMHTKRTHSPSLSLSPSLCPRQARSPGVPSGGWAGSTCGRKAPTSVCVSWIGSVCCVCRSARRALLGFTGCLQVAVGLPSPLQPPSQRGPPPSCPHPGHAAQALGTCLRLPGSKQAEGPSRDICLSVSWASVSQTVTQRGGFWGCPASCTALSLPVFCTKSPSPRRD